MPFNEIRRIVTAIIVFSLTLTGSTLKSNADTIEGAESTINIYNLKIINVIVPIELNVALNPEQLKITLEDGSETTNQIAAQNYGILNKSNYDVDVKIGFTVQDKNNKIVFTDTKAEVNNSSKDEYAVYLVARPADAAGVTTLADGTEIGKDTEGSELGNVSMTPSDEWGIVLKNADTMSFKLTKANWGLKDGYSIVLGETTNDELADMFELKSISRESCCGITFAGCMNKYCNWSNLTEPVLITPSYVLSISDGTEEILENTVNLYEAVQISD